MGQALVPGPWLLFTTEVGFRHAKLVQPSVAKVRVNNCAMATNSAISNSSLLKPWSLREWKPPIMMTRKKQPADTE